MATGMFGFLPSVNMQVIVFYLMWGLIFLGVAGAIITATILLLLNKSKKKFIEINLINRKITNYTGRLRKQKLTNLKNMWVGKLKKFIPPISQKDIFLGKGNKEVVLLVKDKNGLHHTARLPNSKEIAKWYKVVYGIDLDDKENKEHKNKLNHIYLLPNPMEDLNWLADQVVEANETFTDVWWKHPNVLIIATLALCGFIFIISLIVSKKM